ncbi:MAG: Gldg family protein, partial [Bacteroidales bacterium]|nr:Gldg family protein [Bacteroidales bacterium]
VIADPVTPFSESDKFVVDQLVMKGSRVLWLVDPVEVSLDSLSNGFMTLAFPRDVNLNDQLFRYGVRLNADLVQDVLCAQILVNTSGTADRPEFTPQPWYYSPLLSPADNHPVSRNLNLLMGEFVSSIDTVAAPDQVKTTVLLSTSPYGRVVRTPASVSLDAINKPPARELFNRPMVPAGVLLEGQFESVFKNRMLDHLGISTVDLVEKSVETKMMIFSDGSLISNKVRYKAGGQAETLPLGWDRVSRQTFGNKEFFLHAIQYLADDQGILQLRNTAVKLRLLDKVKLGEERQFWVWINTLLPLLFVLLFAAIFNFVRKRK